MNTLKEEDKKFNLNNEFSKVTGNTGSVMMNKLLNIFLYSYFSGNVALAIIAIIQWRMTK